MAVSGTPVEEAAVANLQGAVASGEIAREPAHLDGVKLVALTGGAAVVWLAVSVPYLSLSQRSVTWSGLLAITLLAAIWLVTLRSAFAAGKGTIGTGLSAAIGSGTGLVFVGAINPWFPGLQLRPLGLLGISLGIFASASIWEWFVRQTSAGRTTVLVVGTEELATGIAEEMRRVKSGFHLLGRIGARRSSNLDVPCLGGIPELAQVVDAQRPDIVVLTDETSYKLVVDRLLDVSAAGFRIAGLATFFEYAFGRVPLPHLTPAWFMGVLHLRQHVYARWSKRAFDILVASIGLLLLAPLLPVIALLVRRTDGPVIYRQTRLGEGGRPFTVYKFRTMVCDAEAPDQPQWATECDQRATPIGNFLRRSHLDEIPQLLNVLKGDMSMVGPRPERPEFVAMLEASTPFWSRRLLIKPGVTGWAQISSGYAADCESSADKLSYDLWYIRHRTLAVDVAVCLKTAGLMVSSLLKRRPEPARALARSVKESGL
jgi:exopolysaccharide biosynthesis polyprenyl glycosylphosphotransferase